MRINHVAEAIDDREEFSLRARIVAAEVGSDGIDRLLSEFHSEHTPPEHLKPRFSRLGAWASARQFAIFEILFNIGSESIPGIRKVAFGEYDWTQGNAIEILCRFAAKGIESERTLSDLKDAAPTMREEALIYALRPLWHLSRSDEDLKAIVEQLLLIHEFKDVRDFLAEAGELS
jgi:hypothetical protein